MTTVPTPLVTYSPEFLIREGPTVRRVSHVRLAGRRSYLCDPETKTPPAFRELTSETESPAAKVCGHCGRTLNALLEVIE